MGRRIAIIQGHPQRGGGRLCHALADAYAEGANEAEHSVKRIEVAMLDFPLLRSQAEFERGAIPADIATAQATIRWAHHIVIVYPLWLGSMPSLLQAFFEQTLRPGFGFEQPAHGLPIRRLQGRSARVVVTMGMPALAYRWYFRAHSLKSLKRNILGLCGFGPIHDTLIGMVERMNEARRTRLLKQMRALGRRAT